MNAEAVVVVSEHPGAHRGVPGAIHRLHVAGCPRIPPEAEVVFTLDDTEVAMARRNPGWLAATWCAPCGCAVGYTKTDPATFIGVDDDPHAAALPRPEAKTLRREGLLRDRCN